MAAQWHGRRRFGQREHELRPARARDRRSKQPLASRRPHPSPLPRQRRLPVRQRWQNREHGGKHPRRRQVAADRSRASSASASTSIASIFSSWASLPSTYTNSCGPSSSGQWMCRSTARTTPAWCVKPPVNGDLCLGLNQGMSTTPSRFTVGARVFPLARPRPIAARRVRHRHRCNLEVRGRDCPGIAPGIFTSRWATPSTRWRPSRSSSASPRRCARGGRAARERDRRPRGRKEHHQRRARRDHQV